MYRLADKTRENEIYHVITRSVLEQEMNLVIIIFYLLLKCIQ